MLFDDFFCQILTSTCQFIALELLNTLKRRKTVLDGSKSSIFQFFTIYIIIRKYIL